MRFKITRFQRQGLTLKPRWRRPFTVAYGEILTVERLASGFGVRLHTRTTNPMRIACRGHNRTSVEDELRRRGVRIVDEWGAIIAPTLEDFRTELAQEPVRMRQSSDNA